MENNKIATLLVVLLVGLGLGYFWGESRLSTPQANTHMMPGGMMMNNSEMGMGNAMDDMMYGLRGLSGDAFDKAFLSKMIVHHEGAVAMAEAALKDARHSELKSMANEIISAQTREIEQMKAWQKTWHNQ